MTTALTTEREKHQYCREALDIKKDIEWRFVDLGARLYKIKEQRLYEAGWSSWEEYEMELKMSPATVSKLLRIYEIFVLKHSFTWNQIAEAGGWTVVAELLPSIAQDSTKDEVKGLLTTAVTLNRSDLRRTLTEAKTGVSMAHCKHKDYYVLKICRGCGDRETVEDTRKS